MYNIGDIIKLKFRGNYKTPLLQKIINGKHPMLIVDIPQKNRVTIASMSSDQKQIAKQRKHDVVLQDWDQEGLSRQTYVDVSSTGTIDDSNVFTVIGHLTQKDLRKVLSTLKQTTQRQIIESNTIYNTGYPEFLNYKLDDYGRKIFVDFGDIYGNY